MTNYEYLKGCLSTIQALHAALQHAGEIAAGMESGADESDRSHAVELLEAAHINPARFDDMDEYHVYDEIRRAADEYPLNIRTVRGLDERMALIEIYLTSGGPSCWLTWDRFRGWHGFCSGFGPVEWQPLWAPEIEAINSLYFPDEDLIEE